VRWLVVDTSNWLSGRKVLLPALCPGASGFERPRILGQTDEQQVKDSPDIDSDRPVSRQMEPHVYDYYGWSPYWGYRHFTWAGSVMSAVSWRTHPQLGRGGREENYPRAQRDDGDPNLRSVETVTGYHIHATDGEIGHVEDFLVDDTDWSIHYLVIDTTKLVARQEGLISPRSATEIDWSNKLVNLNVDRQKVKDSPAYDPSITVDRPMRSGSIATMATTGRTIGPENDRP